MGLRPRRLRYCSNPLHILKAILLNPNKKLELTNKHFVFPTYYKEGDDIIIINLYLDFTLFFIFACIDIISLINVPVNNLY
jgi:hypothetical protein